MNAKLKLSGVLLGAALSSTGALAASGSCGASKCGNESKKIEKKGSCGAASCGKEAKKVLPKDKATASCGSGSCGKEAKKEAKKATGACGAGKCG